ncbi:substrate-binding and VWA domain-containing protein [Dactylosporangium sp. NPDC005572]|uniref:substrate-binding and VWA domain-containing protein n=1 Tax=Dactylosporangium sp. NPDC005572 TaxID=3156889 RepID=UPI0033AA694E
MASRRLPLVVAVVVGLVAVVGVYFVLRPGDKSDAPEGNAGRSDCVRLEVSASTEKGDLLAELGKQYNIAGRTFDGKCAAVNVRKKTSGAAMQALADGWTDGAAPQVWAPSSSLWLDVLRERTGASDKRILTDAEPASIATSPLVLAMPKPMAEALGWPGKQVGWADVLALSADPQGWGRYGHPEWGKFRLGKDNPHRSTSGLGATVATFYAATGRSSDLTADEVVSPKVTDYVRGVEAGVLHYSDDAVKYLANLAEADAQGKALQYVSAIAMQEELVYLYNSGAPNGDPAQIGKGRKPQVPLVALYPKDGTLMFDHPLVVLADVTDDQKAAAADFQAFLQDPAQQRRFAEHGFRDYQGKAGDSLATTISAPKDQQLSLIDPPSPTVLAKILDRWDELRKKARVLLVIDVSGSMNDTAGNGKSKLEAAKDAAVEALRQLHPDDELAVWAFSTETQDNPGAVYREVVPFTRVGQGGDTIRSSIKGLHAEGGTALYHVVRLAQQHVLANTAPDRINAVVVLTDGKNEYPKDNDLNALLRDVDAKDLEQSVRLFAIAFGDKSDLGTLDRIAKASRGAAYDARNPATITDVFVSVLSNF